MIVKRKHAQNPHDAQAGQQADAAVDAEVDKQGAREEDRTAGQGGAEEVVAGEEGGGVLGVGEGHVDEDALKEDEAGGAVDDDADDGRDPGDTWAGGPGEDEEAHGREEAGDQGRHEAVLLGAEAAGQDVGHEVEVQVEHVDGDADEAGNEDAGEEDADGAEGEVVVDGVDEGEDFEEGVVDAVDEGGVEIHKGDGRVFDGDFEGFDDGGYEYFGRLDVLLVDFRLRAEAGVASE